MSLQIHDVLELSLNISGEDYDLSVGNQLDFLYIGTSTVAMLPTMQLRIVDIHGRLERLLTDMCKITVSMKPYTAKMVTFNFLKYNHQRDQDVTGFYVYTIDAYLAHPVYFIGCSNETYRASASGVLSTICDKSGLTPDLISTSDTMLWAQNNRSFGVMADYVCAHAYSGSTSCMALAVDVDSKMRMRDLNNLGSSVAVHNVIAFDNTPDAMMAVSFNHYATSGVNNVLTGYNNARVMQSIMSATNPVANTVQYTPDSKQPYINTDIKKVAERGRVRFTPIDSGNVHSNFEQAEYQNRRYRNLYSSKLELMLASPSRIKVMDKINFTTVDKNGNKDVAVSGEYIVTGRVFGVRGRVFSERIDCARKGSNAV